MAVEILDFSDQHAEAFSTLNIEWLEKFFYVEPIDLEILSDPQRKIIAPGGAILFARADQEIVGTVALKHNGDQNYEVTKMAVTARYQGAGIGRQLLKAVIERFTELDGKLMYLESHSSLTAALRLYESCGFEHSPRSIPSDYERSDVYMVYRRH